MRKILARGISVLLVTSFMTTGAVGASAANGSGFATAEPSMLTAVMAGVQITPLLTVGDVLPNGYRYESIPDGISVRARGAGRVDLFVNH
jgi:hypothetical protein